MHDAKLVPEIYCTDLAASLRFYTEVLGFTVRFARPEERFAYLDREGAELMLEEPQGRVFLAGELVFPFGRGVNFQIQVTDVAELYDQVTAAAAVVYLPLEDAWYRREQTRVGNRQFVVQDPDGYLLRFFEDLGAPPPVGDSS